MLDGISFTAVPGTTTAIIGATGSGKTTLLNLLPRFLDATAGEITIGGHDVRALPLDVLREPSSRGAAALLPLLRDGGGQPADGAPEATEDELWQALQRPRPRTSSASCPDGLHAAVGQGGHQLSGGQRQRLCIARALLRAAPVYLFDDSFSALDYGTEARLREAMEPLLARPRC